MRARAPRRVWITGIGLVTPLGIGREAFWAGVRGGRSAIRPLVDLPDEDAAPGADHDDRLERLVLAAGLGAVADAGIAPGRRGHPRADRIGLYLGTMFGALGGDGPDGGQAAGDGVACVACVACVGGVRGSAATMLGIRLAINGPLLTLTGTDAAGTMAIGEAFHRVRDGRLDAALAGGADAPLTPSVVATPAALGLLAPAQAHDPDDPLIAEGAAFLVLEEATVASARGVCPYAELRGYAATSDAHHPTSSAPGGLQAARAARLALADGRLRAAEVDGVIAPGSATRQGDPAAARAIRTALGERGASVHMSTSRVLLGHALAASGAIDASIGVLAIASGWLPGTAGLARPDPDILEVLPGLSAGPIAGPVRAVLSVVLGIGGSNAALAFSRVRDTGPTT